MKYHVERESNDDDLYKRKERGEREMIVEHFFSVYHSLLSDSFHLIVSIQETISFACNTSRLVS
jgi:hypothetical protein